MCILRLEKRFPADGSAAWHNWPMRTLLVFIFLLLLEVPASAGSTASQGCTPAFPFKEGWWGADAAYSIPLADGRVVWIFGDTLYGEKRVVEGKDPRMTRNSVGISRCTGGKWSIEYVIKKNPAGKPADFFPPLNNKYWYWALDGFLHKDVLWVTLLCIRDEPSAKSGDFVLGFATCGTDLAKVTNLAAHPQEWKVEVRPLVPDGVRAYPSATAVVHGDHAYIFGLYEQGSRPMMLTRIPLRGLDDSQGNLQYLANDGKWKPGFDPTQAKEVMRTGSTEMTVRYHPGLKQWIAVLNNPTLPSEKILMRRAPELWGPWGQEEVIYKIPEMDREDPKNDKDTFCYAAKEHPEFRDEESILITYACNTMKVEKLETNLGVYFPKVVRVPLKARADD